MKAIHAVYEDGVFKPTEPVDLPEHCRVRIEPEEGDLAAGKGTTVGDLSRFVGILKDLPMDPMEFQRQIREEWD
jgi:predicted DNA-binding antitoxin AbrB/MazE fold protein